jgi:hypothetical protein
MSEQQTEIPSQGPVETQSPPRRRTRPPVATLIVKELMVGLTVSQGEALQIAADCYGLKPSAYVRAKLVEGLLRDGFLHQSAFLHPAE